METHATRVQEFQQNKMGEKITENHITITEKNDCMNG